MSFTIYQDKKYRNLKKFYSLGNHEKMIFGKWVLVKFSSISLENVSAHKLFTYLI